MNLAEVALSRAAKIAGGDWLQHQWVMAGVVASSARFLPVPLLDDVVRSHCRRFVVSRTLAACGSSLTVASLEPLYGDAGGWLKGALGFIGTLLLQLLLFPVRKFVEIVTSVRGVPMDIMRTVLLGRTLRRLCAGQLAPEQAQAMQRALDEAFARMDFRAVRAAIGDAMRGVRAWRASAIASARRLSSAEAAPDGAMPAGGGVQSSAALIEEVLRQADTLRLFEEFDRRFDDAFARALAAARPSG